MKKYLAISAAFVAFSAQPLQITDLAHFGDMGVFATADAGNGNGHGGGNGGGNGGGRGNSGNHGNAGINGNGGNGGGDVSDDGSADTADSVDVADVSASSGKALGQSKEKNIHAMLGRLNSLKRNINGIMKSSDPHLAEIRTFILNSAELAKAETALAAAETTLANAQAAYDAAVAAGADQTTLDQLSAAVTDAQNAVTTAEANVATYQALTSDAVLTDALASASNKGTITPAMLDWSKAVLGVGDQTGAIDAYMAKFQ